MGRDGGSDATGPEDIEDDALLDEADDDAGDDDADEPYLLRLVPESAFRETGHAAPTGIHLVLYGPDCAGLDAWDLGELWGYSPPELEAMRRAGDHLLAVLQAPAPSWGRATAEGVAALVARLRPEAVDHADAATLARALSSTPAEAEARGLRRLQRQLSAVLGIRDGAFGTDRLAPRAQEEVDLPFFLDEKLAEPGANGLAPGSALPVEAYPGLAVVRRLPWDEDAEAEE